MNPIISFSARPPVPVIPQSRLSQKIINLMENKTISETYLEGFFKKYTKDIATFAIKKPSYWKKFTKCMQQHLEKSSKISILLKKLDQILPETHSPTFSQIFPRELRRLIALAIPPALYRNTDTLVKIRMLFLGDLPPLESSPSPAIRGIPIFTLSEWVSQKQAPIFTLNMTDVELNLLLPQLEYADLTKTSSDKLLFMLSKTEKTHHLSLNNLSASIINHIKNLQRITSLMIIDSNTVDDDLKYIRPLKELRSLSLRKCSRITDEGIKHLFVLHRLTHLDISYCTNITDEGLRSLKDLGLLSLDITYCHKITNAGLEPFTLKHLETKYCHRIT